MGIDTIPLKDFDPLRAEIPQCGMKSYALGGAALTAVVARHLLDQHTDRLPDLSGLTVLVPNHRAGQDFARVLAREAGRPALIPPHIVPLKTWAESLSDGHGEPQARRLARLHGVLRRVDWLGNIENGRWRMSCLRWPMSCPPRGWVAPSDRRFVPCTPMRSTARRR